MQKKINPFVLLFVCCFTFCSNVTAQNDSSKIHQIDAYDLIGNVSKHFDTHHHDSIPKRVGKFHFPIIPVIGYSWATGIVGGCATSIAFYTTESNNANLSNILSQFLYTQKNQIIFTVQPVIWTNNNKYLIKSDYIYLNYPTQTFGLGTRTTENDIDYIDYSHLRIYQTVLRQVIPDFFVGMGYNLDYHYNITQQDNTEKKVYNNTNYLFTQSSVSSGLTLNFAFDNRRNSINPQGGFYLNAVFRNNQKILGSDENWQSLFLDIRKYFVLHGKAKNILSFWSYNVFTLNGNPPYLDLPATGLDEYGNTGRGYIQGRFRGKNMIDLESEFRFKITKNGLLGGVLFANAQDFSKSFNSISNNIVPGGGFGVRIKVHKHTDTNLCVDYGFGINGSNGLFLNLNEVF